MWVNIDGVNAKSITVDGNTVGLITVDGKIAYIGWKAGVAVGAGTQTIYNDRLEINVPDAPSEDTAYRTFEGVIPYDYTNFTTMYVEWEILPPNGNLCMVNVGLALPNTVYDNFHAKIVQPMINEKFTIPRRVESLNISGLTHTALVPKFCAGDVGKYSYGTIARIYNIWFE
ncbi:MAG: hypothetical protein AB7S52_02765 [Sphaerochaetaceae bacterium]